MMVVVPLKKALLVSENIKDGYKYLGGYDEQDVYQEDINVSLILNPSNCAPCLSSLGDNDSFFFQFSFSGCFC